MQENRASTITSFPCIEEWGRVWKARVFLLSLTLWKKRQQGTWIWNNSLLKWRESMVTHFVVRSYFAKGRKNQSRQWKQIPWKAINTSWNLTCPRKWTSETFVAKLRTKLLGSWMRHGDTALLQKEGSMVRDDSVERILPGQDVPRAWGSWWGLNANTSELSLGINGTPPPCLLPREGHLWAGGELFWK